MSACPPSSTFLSVSRRRPSGPVGVDPGYVDRAWRARSETEVKPLVPVVGTAAFLLASRQSHAGHEDHAERLMRGIMHATSKEQIET